LVQIIVLQFHVLVQTTLRAVSLMTCTTLKVFSYLISGATMPFMFL